MRDHCPECACDPEAVCDEAWMAAARDVADRRAELMDRLGQ